MLTINPDLQWYIAISESKGINSRCPYATVHRCHRFYESSSILSSQGITTKLPRELDKLLLNKWKTHELWPHNMEGSTTISGENPPNCLSNFCPEVTFETFNLFATLIIRFIDDIDRDSRHSYLIKKGVNTDQDWRWHYEHIEPLHYSNCPIFSKIGMEKPMPQINIHGNVNGQLNVAGESVNSPIFQLSLADLITKIDDSDAPPQVKKDLKQKIDSFLSHPLVVALAGGLAGSGGA